MKRLLTILGLLLSLQQISVSSMQLVRVKPVPSVGPLLMARHNAYVDQKVHSNPLNVLNHNSWYLRNVVMQPTNTSAADENTFTLTSSAASPSTMPTKLSSLKGLHLAEALAVNSPDTWNNDTDTACNSALSAMNGIPSNPSGMAVCYNVQDMNNATGAFHIDTSLYRISAPHDDWTQLNAESVKVGLVYGNAYITQHNSAKTKRDETSIPWSLVDRTEAYDMFLLRMNGAPPKKLVDLSFVGQVHNSMLGQLKNESTAYTLLVPSISLSGVKENGSQISTLLSLQDASFLNGLFSDHAQSRETNKTTIPSKDSLHLESPFSFEDTLAVLPIGFVVACVWALMLLATLGYGIFERTSSRNAYRRAVKRGLKAGPTIIYMQ